MISPRCTDFRRLRLHEIAIDGLSERPFAAFCDQRAVKSPKFHKGHDDSARYPDPGLRRMPWAQRETAPKRQVFQHHVAAGAKESGSVT